MHSVDRLFCRHKRRRHGRRRRGGGGHRDRRHRGERHRGGARAAARHRRRDEPRRPVRGDELLAFALDGAAQHRVYALTVEAARRVDENAPTDRRAWRVQRGRRHDVDAKRRQSERHRSRACKSALKCKKFGVPQRVFSQNLRGRI